MPYHRLGYCGVACLNITVKFSYVIYLCFPRKFIVNDIDNAQDMHRWLIRKGNNMQMNESQRKAVNHFTGPCMVLAGPGSGKTTVITKRVQHLISECKVRPQDILVITFTKAAAMEMKQRFEVLQGGGCPVTFGTFHAVFFSILRHAYHYNASNIIKEFQKTEILKELIEREKLELEDENDFVRQMEGEISKVKGEMLDLSNYFPVNTSKEVFERIFHGYQKELGRRRLIDFDDMMIYCHELFTARPDILQLWQKRYPFILVDEFQDIDRGQYQIVQMLAKPGNNLFIVGDDDQSIYRFRGAKPEIMLNFEKDYPDCNRIFLSVNYRSTRQIVKMADLVIRENKKRFAKDITTINEEGLPIEVLQTDDVLKENDALIRQLTIYREQGIPLSEMAVLYRTNTQVQSLAQRMITFNIPFYMKEKIPNLYEHWIAVDVLTYIRIALGSDSRSDYLKIINRPNRYISRGMLSENHIDLGLLQKDFELDGKDWMAERVEKLRYDLTMLRAMRPFAAITYIRKGIEYNDYLKEYASYHQVKSEDLFEVLDQLAELAKPYDTYEEWFDSMEEYKKELEEKQKKPESDEEAVDRVNFATMHGSKGLEYQVVFIIDANEGFTPYKKAVMEEDIEEERRLFYVAMTRAKKYLHIYYTKERYGREQTMSRFLTGVVKEVSLK